jgi:endonuclease/exonuclease/phosphatase family metal-dependent hydrolase
VAEGSDNKGAKASAERKGAKGSAIRKGAKASAERKGAKASAERKGAKASAERKGAKASAERKGAKASAERKGAKASAERKGLDDQDDERPRKRTTASKLRAVPPPAGRPPAWMLGAGLGAVVLAFGLGFMLGEPAKAPGGETAGGQQDPQNPRDTDAAPSGGGGQEAGCDDPQGGGAPSGGGSVKPPPSLGQAPYPGFPAFTDREAHLILASWNVQGLGDRRTDERRLDRMALVLAGFDLVALQELEDPGAHDALTAICAELAKQGRFYSFWISPSTGYSGNTDDDKGNYTKRCGFLWDSHRLRMVGWPAPLSEPVINNPVFREVPFTAGFEVTGGQGFDFRVLTVHTVFKQELSRVRRGEIEAIRDWMLGQTHGGEQDLISLGDFNSDPPTQARGDRYFESLLTGSGLRVLLHESRDAGEDSVRTTVPRQAGSNNPDYFKEPVYDQVLVTPVTGHALSGEPVTQKDMGVGVVQFDMDPWWEANGLSRVETIEVTTDHRPIWVRLDYGAEDRDPD